MVTILRVVALFVFVRAFTSVDVDIIANSPAVLCLLGLAYAGAALQQIDAGISRHLRLARINDSLGVEQGDFRC